MEWTPFSAVTGRADGAEGTNLSFPEYMLSEWLDLQDIQTGRSFRRLFLALLGTLGHDLGQTVFDK